MSTSRVDFQRVINVKWKHKISTKYDERKPFESTNVLTKS